MQLVLCGADLRASYRSPLCARVNTQSISVCVCLCVRLCRTRTSYIIQQRCTISFKYSIRHFNELWPLSKEHSRCTVNVCAHRRMSTNIVSNEVGDKSVALLKVRWGKERKK